jgi:hypothetical protein
MPHEVSYRIRNEHGEPARSYPVDASPEDLRQLREQGFLVRPAYFSGETLEDLRAAADGIEAEELAKNPVREGTGFGGLFVRNLVDRHPLFARILLAETGLLNVARAVLGPQVQIHASVLRVAYPDLAHQGVEWHFHQRVVPDPLPPFFLRPAVIDNLIYLDEITPERGPLVVIPGSHEWNLDLPPGDHTDKPGQVALTVPAGSVVTSHSSLWHKAIAPLPTSGRRRLLILGYSPTWLKQIDVPTGLQANLRAQGDAPRDRLELAGLSGWY